MEIDMDAECWFLGDLNGINYIEPESKCNYLSIEMMEEVGINIYLEKKDLIYMRDRLNEIIKEGGGQ